jgi:hypothetical protein
MSLSDDDTTLHGLTNGSKSTTDMKGTAWGEEAFKKLIEYKKDGDVSVDRNTFFSKAASDDAVWTLTTRGKLRLKNASLDVGPDNECFYVREFGWCRCECSCNTVTGNLEPGVSVYICEGRDDQYYGHGPAWDKNWRGKTPSHDSWFLVKGVKQDALGGDGDPLLKDVSVISGLVWLDHDKVFKRAAAGNREKNHKLVVDGICKCEKHR